MLSKDTIKKVKNSENKESIYKLSDTGLASPIYKKCITRQKKTTNNPILKRAKVKRHFSRKDIWKDAQHH